MATVEEHEQLAQLFEGLILSIGVLTEALTAHQPAARAAVLQGLRVLAEESADKPGTRRMLLAACRQIEDLHQRQKEGGPLLRLVPPSDDPPHRE
jgi:hypothetical protein